jgi:tRNA pseudouridine55 synthase
VDALFNVYKPRGPTSHDVVARLRRASGVRRVGHAGTLDPMAEGVLVVAVGQVTRIIEYLVDAEKEYEAEVTFGVETDTYDAEGSVLVRRPVDHLTAEQVEAALPAFRGSIAQRPPAHSAISVGGRRLYELARRGVAVDVPVRQVEITRLELTSFVPPKAVLRVECSKGTYMRSLAHDLGQALGCGAHLSGLIRTRIGRFTAQEAVKLEELEAQLRQGTWRDVAIPLADALAHLPAVQLDGDEARRLQRGQALRARPAPDRAGTLAVAYGQDGDLVGVVRRGERDGDPVWRPEKVLIRSDIAVQGPGQRDRDSREETGIVEGRPLAAR